MTRARRIVAVATAGTIALAVLAPGASYGAGLPADFEPAAISALSTSAWWVLGQSDACVSFPCKTTVLATADGGRSFRTLGSPPIAGASGIYAANARDIFVSSTKGRLWLSPDGGSAWRAVTPTDPRGTPIFFGTPQASNGYAYAVAWKSHGSGNELMRASLGALAMSPHPSSAWKPLPAPEGAVMGLSVSGPEVLVLSQPSSSSAFPRLYVSSDAGTTFNPTGATLPVSGCGFYRTGGAIWADCGTGMLFGIWRSTDDGHHFEPAGSDAYQVTKPTRPVFAGTSGASFVPLSASTALLGLDPLYRTINGGNSYHRLTGSPRGVVQWVQFDAIRPGEVLALGRFNDGGTRADPRFKDRLYAVTASGRRFHLIHIG